MKCNRCKVKLTVKNTYPSLRKSKHHVCKPCHVKLSYKWKNRNKEKELRIDRRHRLFKKYGLTLEEYEYLFNKQLGSCALCFKEHPRRALSVDHDHKTGQIRGLLCDRCNLAIGLLGDDEKIVQNLAWYFL